ncbi:hypothetical protein ACLOJK_012986 [Asimina triloba]
MVVTHTVVSDSHRFLQGSGFEHGLNQRRPRPAQSASFLQRRTEPDRADGMGWDGRQRLFKAQASSVITTITLALTLTLTRLPFVPSKATPLFPFMLLHDALLLGEISAHSILEFDLVVSILEMMGFLAFVLCLDWVFLLVVLYFCCHVVLVSLVLQMMILLLLLAFLLALTDNEREHACRRSCKSARLFTCVLSLVVTPSIYSGKAHARSTAVNLFSLLGINVFRYEARSV